MNSVLEKYFSRKKSELINYINEILIIFSYKVDIDIPNKMQIVKKVLGIYFDEYYMISSVDYSTVNKYYKIDSETDNDIKTILQCVIEYYEKENIDVKDKNNEIIYLSYIIYFAFLINRLKDTIVIVPNKTEFIVCIAGKVSPNFTYKKDDKFKNHINNLISMIRTNIKDDKKLRAYLNKIKNNDSYNEYITLNDEINLYKIKYNYVLNEIKAYSETDINKVNDRENIDNTFKLISYELSLITLLKCILYDQRVYISLKIDKKFYKKKSTVTSFVKFLKSKYIRTYSSLLINSSEYEECEEMDRLKELGIKIIIECDKYEDINNIKFNNNIVLLVTNEFIIKYKQELDSKNIKYIKKTSERIYREKDLFFTKIDFMEVNNE